MKKTMVLLLIVAIISCRKDTLEDLGKIKEVKELKIANRDSPDTLTLQNVKLYATRKDVNYFFTFNWGYQSSFNSFGGNLIATDIKTSVTTKGHTWVQVNALWQNTKKNPDVFVLIITGTESHIEMWHGMAETIKNNVIIQIKYNVKTQIDITTVTSSEIMYVK